MKDSFYHLKKKKKKFLMKSSKLITQKQAGIKIKQIATRWPTGPIQYIMISKHSPKVEMDQ